MSESNTTHFNVWLVAKPAPDVPGEWYVHCLDFDVMSQGRSPLHALEMGVEAVTMCLEGDLADGEDPFAVRPRAAQAAYDELYRVLREGARPAGAIAQLDAHRDELAVVVVAVRIDVATEARGSNLADSAPFALPSGDEPRAGA